MTREFFSGGRGKSDVRVFVKQSLGAIHQTSSKQLICSESLAVAAPEPEPKPSSAFASATPTHKFICLNVLLCLSRRISLRQAAAC